MSFELSLDETSKGSEYKWKELLYTLFYEIKSEILGCKIEIEEADYQQNIKSITIGQAAAGSICMPVNIINTKITAAVF